MGQDWSAEMASVEPEYRRPYKTLWQREKRLAERLAAHLQALAAAHQRQEELDQLAGCVTHTSCYPDCFDD